jgi:hypothetical protein
MSASNSGFASRPAYRFAYAGYLLPLSGLISVRRVGKGALGAVPTIFLIGRLRADLVGTPPDAFAPGRFAHPTIY